MKCEWGGDGRPVWGQGYCAEHARMNIGCARTNETELFVQPIDAEVAVSVEVMCHALAMGGAR